MPQVLFGDELQGGSRVYISNSIFLSKICFMVYLPQATANKRQKNSAVLSARTGIPVFYNRHLATECDWLCRLSKMCDMISQFGGVLLLKYSLQPCGKSTFLLERLKNNVVISPRGKP